MSLLTCENISIGYEQTKIINNLSFNINEGDYVCVIGENGAGKSTLLKGILGLVKINEGKLTFCDNDVKNQIGYLPQQTALQNDFPASVSEIVLSGCLNCKKLLPFYTKEQKITAKLNMKVLGIDNLAKMSYNELSGGQKQRVLLARALSSSSKLLILDEPVANLDPKASNDFYHLLKHINSNHQTTIIMVTHDLATSLEYASHILYMGENDYFFGTKEEYLRSTFSTKLL